MSKTFIELEDISAQLLEARNLLECFLEFCEEGHITPNTEFKEASWAALIFASRVDTHAVTVRLSMDILVRAAEQLEKMAHGQAVSVDG